MRAVLVWRTGGPEVLEVADVPEPQPGTGQVRVDVAAAGVNFIDVYHRTGKYPLPLPFVAGSEGAGTVSSVGEGVSDIAVGDHVAWAMVQGSGYAEQVVVAADRVVPIPDGVQDEAAAAVMLQGLTAQYLTSATYAVSPGDVALVHAAAGGVGLLLTQLATARGARVIATTSTPEKAELAVAAGASDVVLYTQADVREEVRHLTGGEGVHVVYDGVGRATFEAGLDCLRPRGTMVLFGASSGPPAALDPAVLGAKGSLFLTRPSLAHHIASATELRERSAQVLGWVADGVLDVRVGARYALAEAPRAHADLEARRTTGKSLLLPSD